MPTLNQTVSVLQFFLKVTLRRYEIIEHTEGHHPHHGGGKSGEAPALGERRRVPCAMQHEGDHDLGFQDHVVDGVIAFEGRP
ncbi:MAG: hypothetical protein ACHQAY_23650 [Hyphomicrobiales bacterium]